MEAIEGIVSFGVTDGYELPDVGGEKRTEVLRRVIHMLNASPSAHHLELIFNSTSICIQAFQSLVYLSIPNIKVILGCQLDYIRNELQSRNGGYICEISDLVGSE